MTSQYKTSKLRSKADGPLLVPPVELAASPPLALTLHARLREQLRLQIESGHWQVNQQLPSESQLVKQHSVSRITVRQALADLAALALITRVQGKGSFVAPPPVRQELSRLQGLAEALGSQGRSVTTQVLAMTETRLAPRPAKVLGLLAGIPCMVLRTLRFADGRPLSLNHTVMCMALGQSLKKYDLAALDLLTLYESALGIRVEHAELEIRAAKTDAEHCGLLGLQPKDAVLQVERAVFAVKRQPVHFELSTYPAETFSFRLELAR